MGALGSSTGHALALICHLCLCGEALANQQSGALKATLAAELLPAPVSTANRDQTGPPSEVLLRQHRNLTSVFSPT